MSDRLASLMSHFPVSARVFNAGPLCGVNTLESDGTHGQLHLVRSGTLKVSHGGATLQIEKPSVLLFPRPLTHRFISDAELFHQTRLEILNNHVLLQSFSLVAHNSIFSKARNPQDANFIALFHEFYSEKISL